MAIPIAALASLAGALKGGGGAKSTSTSNVASDITASITNYIGDSGSLGGTTGGGAAASPSLSDATGGSQWPSYLSGGIQPVSEGLGPTLGNGAGGGLFDDPVILIGGVAIVGAVIYFATQGK